MQEEWRKTRFRGYRVSTLGRVKSITRTVVDKNGNLKRLKGKILKHGRVGAKRDYHSVVMPGALTRLVHILVCTAFHGRRPGPNYEVNHIDGNKDNNRADNLEWVTKKQNAKHASKMGLASGGSLPGSSHPLSKLTEKDVLNIRRRLSGNPPRGLKAMLARHHKIGKSLITKILNRSAWSHI